MTASALLGAGPLDYNQRTMTQIARRTTAVLAAGLSLLLSPACVAAQELPDVADRVQASVVSIAAERTDQTPAPQSTGDQDADAAKPNLRQGSGMVLSADGYVITATSLVDKVGKITVTLSDGKQLAAQVIGRDPRTAIALLKASGAT